MLRCAAHEAVYAVTHRYRTEGVIPASDDLRRAVLMAING